MKQFNFTISYGVAVMIMESSLNKAIDRFKLIFGEFLFTQVKYVEIC